MRSRYTARGNLVGVITNGTAVLGLGDIGPLASKPVMEGKAVLFKKFAGIDVFDIEVAEKDAEPFIEAVARLEPTFGGINLEDIKAPECFEIERRLKARMKIPVFHDDQHGTAIVVAAGILNGLKVVGKKLEDVKLVTSGAGAAALACLNQLVALGLKRENVWVTDIKGVVYKGRKELMDPYKEPLRAADQRAHAGRGDAGADVFLGLSAGGVVSREMVATMAPKPLVFALANPTPEIMPEDVKAVRPDAVIASGRTDYPNQINNVLCFPFVFRGALDVGATTINEEMKKAAVDRARPHRRERGLRHRAVGLRRGYAGVRARLHPAQAVRSAPDHRDRAGGRQGGDGDRRRDAADRGLRRLPREAVGLRLPLGLPDEADVRCGQARASASRQADRLRRGRAPLCAAGGAAGDRRRHRAADPGRPTRRTSRGWPRIWACRMRAGAGLRPLRPRRPIRAFRS